MKLNKSDIAKAVLTIIFLPRASYSPLNLTRFELIKIRGIKMIIPHYYKLLFIYHFYPNTSIRNDYIHNRSSY
jgi:hypothetical protein